MNAVLAIITGGGWAIVVIYRETVEINYFIIYFIILYQTLCWWSHPTLSKEAPGGVVHSFMETMPLDGKTAHRGGDVCVMCVTLAKSLLSGSILFPRMHSGVKLLTPIRVQFPMVGIAQEISQASTQLPPQKSSPWFSWTTCRPRSACTMAQDLLVALPIT
jgi:hypothetical protein